MSETNRVYDATRGKESLDTVLPGLEALDEDQLEPVNVDLQGASVVALNVADFIKEPDVKRKFELLPSELFDIQHVNALPELAYATWYSRIEYLRVTSPKSQAKVPIKLIGEGQDTKSRMFKVVDYHLGEDPDIAPEIASIRSGTGYFDLATDLVRLSSLYEEHKPELEIDGRFYRAEDEQASRDISIEVMKYLGVGESKEEKKWIGIQMRAWTALKQSYNQVRAAGRFIFRDSSLKENFPSIVTASRQFSQSRSDP